MGRIKTKLVKRITYELISEHPEEFTAEFRENGKIAEKYVDFPSKKLRNTVAGYVTRIVKKQKETA